MIATILFWTVLLIINAVWVMFHPWAMPGYAVFLYWITFLLVGGVFLWRRSRKNRID